jgi:hypothetical protein
MSSLQSTPLVLASADTAVAAQPAAAQVVATTAAPANKGGFSEKPTAGELIEFQATGLLVVFVVLGAITAISMFLSWLLKVFLPNQYYVKATHAPAAKAAPAAPAAKAAPVAAAAAVTSSGLSQEKLLVILTAAAHEVLGVPVSVVSFRPVGSADALWVVQGRATHHSSHKL